MFDLFEQLVKNKILKIHGRQAIKENFIRKSIELNDEIFAIEQHESFNENCEYSTINNERNYNDQVNQDLNFILKKDETPISGT